MQNIGACATGSKWQEEAYLFFRVVTGFLFFYHGYEKVFGMGTAGVAGFFGQVGVPLANVVAVLVAYGELIGGIALILGLCTHWVAKLNVIIMLGAIYFVHLANGYSMANGGYEYALLILAANLVIIAMGAGKYSLDAKRAKPPMAV